MEPKSENLSRFAGVCLFAVILAFVATLVAYSDSWLVPWHDEVVISRLAQNLAEGKGFRNDLMDDLLTGADERTYWQMPLYPFVLSLWGKLFGFELNTLRWFNRIIGVVSLILLFLLARNFNLPFEATMLVLLWTATDLTFQFAANFVRPDALTGCLLLLVALSLASQFCKSASGVALTGFISALTVFNHPIAFPCWLTCGAIVVKRWGWRNGLLFLSPLVVFAFFWLLYALQGWEIFLAQVKAHLSHKHYPLTDFLAFLMGVTTWGTEFYIGVPLNAMPLLLPIVVTAYVGFREKWLLPKGFVAFATVLYVSAMLGAEAWYPALFVPFGYLMLAAFANHLLQKTAMRFGRLAILFGALFWWSYQVSVVAHHLSAIPKIREQVANFVSDLGKSLPPKAKVLIGSFSPDPTFALLSVRPDIKVYALMPRRMLNMDAMRQLRSQLTHMLVLKEATAEPEFTGEEIGRWQFDFGGLSRDKRLTVVLLSVGKKRHNSELRKDW